MPNIIVAYLCHKLDKSYENSPAGCFKLGESLSRSLPLKEHAAIASIQGGFVLFPNKRRNFYVSAISIMCLYGLRT